MAVDASIYNALAAPQKNAFDYAREFEAADAQREQRNMLRQQNALQLQQAQQAQADDMAYREAAKRFGADSAANVNQLMQAGLPKQAMAYQKSAIDNQKVQSDIGESQAKAKNYASEVAKRDFDTTQAKRMSRLQELVGVNDPQTAIQWIDDGVANHDLPADKAAMIKQRIAADPAAFQQWKTQAIAAGFTLQQQAENEFKNRQLAETERHNRDVTATTRRGQNMTDARARESNDINRQASRSQIIETPDGYAVVDKGTGQVRQAVGADGKPVTGKPADAKPLTESQGKATNFAARMQDAESVIQDMERQGVSGSDFRTMAAGGPWTNFMASAKGQQYRQAQENWVTANLRQESGAAIGKEEMDKDIRKFFPVPGDAPEVIAQKAQARRVATQGMLTQAGPGASKVPGILGASRQSGGGAPTPVTSDADYNALPPGTRFITPDGKLGTKR